MSQREPRGVARVRPAALLLIKLWLGLVAVELFAIYFLGVVNEEHLTAGIVVIAGLYLVATCLVFWVRSSNGLGSPFSYCPALAHVPARPRYEPQFGNLRGRVDSHLHNVNRVDELHPVIVELVRERLTRHHGIDLDDQLVARPVLGESLAAYVYNPPRKSMSGRTAKRLTALLTRIEEL